MADQDDKHSVEWQSGKEDAENGTYQNIVTHFARSIMGRQEDYQDGYEAGLQELNDKKK